jgi:hypothetical protein
LLKFDRATVKFSKLQQRFSDGKGPESLSFSNFSNFSEGRILESIKGWLNVPARTRP